MKTAKLMIEAVGLICPHCGEDIAGPEGSYLIDEDQWAYYLAKAKTVHCINCEQEVKLPANPFTRNQIRVEV